MTYRSDTLKEAIVNKLKEYDAYIDNELPDYILVMLANKKTVAQISQDLELFLGDNTKRFSNWLKGVLEKPELLSPSTTHGRKRTFDTIEPKEVEEDVIETPPPTKRKIIVRSSTQEGDKETNRSSTYKRLEIVRETTTHETTHHSSKKSDVSVSASKEDENEEEDEPVATTLASVIKRPVTERKPQPSGRILLKAISAIQGNSRSNRNKPDRKEIKQQSEVISSSDSQQVDDLANKEVEELPSGDLRRRLGKKSTPSQSDSTANEETSPTDVTTETERIVVRPKFVVTMNQVDDKYKTDTEKKVMSNEASDDLDVSPSVVPERCRFWPNCKNGDICPYYHPSVPCKLFPKCKFGDKCRFIHPICKFNAQCMKPGCPYLHTAPRNKQALGSGVFPIPTGVMATAPLDVGSHYKWNPPGAHHKTNQYVWTSSKTHISERRFAASEKPTHMPVSANI